MQPFFYDYEPGNRIIYDDARKYCLLEQLNEENFRYKIKKPNRLKIMKSVLKRITDIPKWQRQKTTS